MSHQEKTIRQPKSAPSIAVVIGSGGIKTFGAVTLLQFMEEVGIRPDLLIGSSGGAMMVGLIAAGYKPAEMIGLLPEFIKPDLLSEVDYQTLWGLPGLPFGRYAFDRALLKTDKLRDTFRRMFGDLRLENTSPKALLQVTDFQTGEGFVLEEGLVADAVYASGAAYPILPMLRVQDRWVMDGGFSSPCPVLEAVKRQIDIIIAVTFETTYATMPQGLLPLFQRTQFLCTSTLMRTQMATAIKLHHHEIFHINLSFDRPIEMWHFDEIPFILETGQQAVNRKKDDILTALQDFGRQA